MKVKDGVLVNVRDEDIELLVNNPTKFWSGITKIGKEAFRDVNLKETYDIVIPGTVSIVDESQNLNECLAEVNTKLLQTYTTKAYPIPSLQDFYGQHWDRVISLYSLHEVLSHIVP